MVSTITLRSFSGKTEKTVKANTETIKFFEESKQNRRLFALADEETMIQGKLKEFYQKYQKGLANRNTLLILSLNSPKLNPDHEESLTMLVQKTEKSAVNIGTLLMVS